MTMTVTERILVADKFADNFKEIHLDTDHDTEFYNITLKKMKHNVDYLKFMMSIIDSDQEVYDIANAVFLNRFISIDVRDIYLFKSAIINILDDDFTTYSNIDSYLKFVNKIYPYKLSATDKSLFIRKIKGVKNEKI